MSMKKFTSQDMREEAKCFEACGGSSIIATMLRSGADAVDREALICAEIAKIESMEAAPLDGVPDHQNVNARKIAATIEFFRKVKEIVAGDRKVSIDRV